MKCLSFIRNHIGTFMLFCSLFVSFFVSSLFVSNSYADSNPTVTVQQINQYVDVFPDCLADCLNNYSYLKISYQGYPGYSSISFFIRYDGSAQRNFYFGFSSIYNLSSTSVVQFVSLPFDGHIHNFLQFGSNGYFDVPVTFELTNSLSSDAPSGSITLTQNGTYDVTNYAEAIVDVPPEIVYGDYHNDLINITNGIYVCAGTILVIYFFYCIYRLIIKNSGVK